MLCDAVRKSPKVRTIWVVSSRLFNSIFRIESHFPKISQSQLMAQVARDVPPQAGARMRHAFDTRRERVELPRPIPFPSTVRAAISSPARNTTSFLPLYLDQIARENPNVAPASAPGQGRRTSGKRVEFTALKIRQQYGVAAVMPTRSIDCYYSWR
jgi:hypothetical protein